MKHALWNITGKCNLHCGYCWSRAHTKTDRELALPRKQALLRELRRMGCQSLVLTGGEPLLADRFWEVLSECDQLGFNIHLLTNGTLVGDREAQMLANSQVSEVHVSLDSLDVKRNDVYRSRGQQALQGLLRLASVISPERLVVSVVLLARRLPQLAEMAAKAPNLGFRVQYQMCCVDPLHSLWEEDPRSLTMAERQQWFAELRSIHKTFGRSLHPSTRAYFHHAHRWLLGSRLPATPCPAGSHVTVVGADGSFSPCFQDGTAPERMADCFDLPCVIFFRATL